MPGPVQPPLTRQDLVDLDHSIVKVGRLNHILQVILLGQEDGADRQADHFFGLAFIDEDQFHAGPTGINDQTVFNRQGP